MLGFCLCACIFEWEDSEGGGEVGTKCLLPLLESGFNAENTIACLQEERINTRVWSQAGSLWHMHSKASGKREYH